MESTIQIERPPEAASNCKHHWLIESANGPTSHARCKTCRAEREFYNDPDMVLRDRPAPAER